MLLLDNSKGRNDCFVNAGLNLLHAIDEVREAVLSSASTMAPVRELKEVFTGVRRDSRGVRCLFENFAGVEMHDAASFLETVLQELPTRILVLSIMSRVQQDLESETAHNGFHAEAHMRGRPFSHGIKATSSTGECSPVHLRDRLFSAHAVFTVSPSWFKISHCRRAHLQQSHRDHEEMPCCGTRHA
jgi:hypothetical protein